MGVQVLRCPINQKHGTLPTQGHAGHRVIYSSNTVTVLNTTGLNWELWNSALWNSPPTLLGIKLCNVYLASIVHAALYGC